MKQKNKLVAWQLWVSFKGKNVIATSRFANLSFQLEKIITSIVARFKQQYGTEADPILTDVEESAQKEMNITSCEYGHNLQYHHPWSYQDISLVIILSSALIELKAQVWEEHIDKEKLLRQIQLASKARYNFENRWATLCKENVWNDKAEYIGCLVSGCSLTRCQLLLSL